MTKKVCRDRILPMQMVEYSVSYQFCSFNNHWFSISKISLVTNLSKVSLFFFLVYHVSR